MTNFDRYDAWNFGALFVAGVTGIKILAPFGKKAIMKFKGDHIATTRYVDDKVDELEQKVAQTIDKSNNVLATAILDIKDMVKGLCDKNGVEIPEHEKPQPEVQVEAEEEEDDENDEA